MQIAVPQRVASVLHCCGAMKNVRWLVGLFALSCATAGEDVGETEGETGSGTASLASSSSATGSEPTTAPSSTMSTESETTGSSESEGTSASASAGSDSTSTSTSTSGEQSGLDFPSNGDEPSDAFVAAQIRDPHLDGLPMWGPDGAGTTWIWKILPRHQTGYYVTFWWSAGDGSFLWDQGSPNSYYGGHPYPDSGNNRGTTHAWEIATDYGGDYRDTRLGYGQYKAVVYDQWYTQALRVTRNPDGSKTLVFYTELPSVADGDVIEVTVSPGYGEALPPEPMITLGDSPWYAGFQHERLSGVLRHIKIFDRVLSEDEMLEEAASPEVSSDGIWYRKIDPRPDDLLCDSATGREFAWADPEHTAGLWTGPEE
jgi:hypothetical protein